MKLVEETWREIFFSNFAEIFSRGEARAEQESDHPGPASAGAGDQGAGAGAGQLTEHQQWQGLTTLDNSQPGEM